MRCHLLVLRGVCFGMLTCCVSAAVAQTQDIAIFDGQNNDFLLPSYFDTPTAAVPMQDQRAAPQSVPADVDILNEIFGNQSQTQSAASTTSKPMLGQTFYPNSTAKTFYPTPKNIQQAQKKPLLTPLAPLPEKVEESIPPPKNFQHKSIYASKLLAKEMGKAKSNIELPRDIRLQFNAGATQLAEQSMKWVMAYAVHVQKDPRLVFTIRVSNRDWAVQLARLSLIVKIAMEKGLAARQIQVFQSDRDPDTVIIGAEPNQQQTQVMVPEETKRVIREQKTLVW